MNKPISFILVLSALLVCLAGCGDQESEKRQYKDPSQQETVTKADDTDESTAETGGELENELPRIPVN